MFSLAIPQISDNVILNKYSVKFNHGNINNLIWLLDDPDDLNLQDVAKKYPTPQIKAYHVIKKWLKVNNTDEAGLHSKLEELGLISSRLAFS